MAKVIRFHGKVPSKSVRGLPPGTTREVLTAPCVDSAGKTWPQGAEFVAQAGRYDNALNAKYIDAVFVSAEAAWLTEATS